ncbi:MAG TPA: hypothetical protein VMC79_01370 [Rectinemataceae bacterium]|nr:hypothetical protein [Rectinemataceae bacterium]
MRIPKLRPPRPLVEGLAAVGAGTALFALAAILERAFSMGTVASACTEELGKGLLLLLAACAGRALYAAPSHAPASAARLRRVQLLASARGLSLGLVAVASFAAVENLAYFAVFPEAGVLERLLWSLPVHLVSALVEAVGVLALMRALVAGGAGNGSKGGAGGGGAGGVGALLRLGRGGAILTASVGAGIAWHSAANMMVERGLGLASLVAGSVAALALAALLFALYLGTAYIGGFLHGSH